MNIKSLQKFLRPDVIVAATAIIAVLVVGIVYLMTSIKPSEAYVLPTSGTIVQEVNTTGTVAAATSLDLSFQTGGQISYAGPAVGTHVSAGATLATLSGADLEAQLEQAKAGLAAAQAQLASLQAGATPQAIAVSQTSLTNAQNALTQAKQSIIQASQDGYVKADDAIHNKVDQFFSNPRSSSPSLNITSSNSQLTISAQSGRVTMEATLTAWQSYLASLPVNPNSADITSIETKTSTYLTQVGAYLDQVASLLSTATPSNSVSATTLQTYQANVATARANISAAITELNSVEIAEQSAVSAVATAQSELTLTQAPPTQNAIDAQNAAVSAAQANVDLAQAQLNKTVITAPISGTITVNNANLGETASVGAPMISIISDSKFQMDVYVSDADVAKIKVGDVAAVTLDAYQSDAPFSAHVIEVDPAATMTNGVSSYKVTLQFDANDPRIQSGMTGSAAITTQTDDDALSVPSSAIITQGTSTFVFVQASGGDREVPVSTGITSAAGMTEILSGINPTDQVRTFGQSQ
ncbi:MAG TPA: efflux RND transporter periplasmic adaptor subunit [Candidatus Paceibacterota bacterium]|nr:efflux RND transporter periplasmic adaptor subunit [Candidatus Paceibacterota bacterium]